MMRRTPLMTVAYGLMGLLLVSAILIAVGRKSGNSEPGIGSFAPSGMSLLGSLLRDAGYEMRATRDPTPALDPTQDVPIAIVVRQGGFAPDNQVIDALMDRLEKFGTQGGVVIVGSMAQDFGAATRANRPETVRSPYTDAKATLHHDPSGFWRPAWIKSEPNTTELWIAPGREVVSLTRLGTGRGLFISDFSGAANRFIDQGDNAAVFVGAVRSAVPIGKRLVFLEAAWGNTSEPGLFETIGEWAAAGWNQMIVLGIVIVYTLGRPFGLPEMRRPSQQGQRDLIDAYAGLMNRAGATDIAMHAIAVDADKRIRKALKMDSGLDKEQRDVHLPVELSNLLRQAERAADMRVPSDVAADLANKLDVAVADFTGDRRQSVRKRRKS